MTKEYGVDQMLEVLPIHLRAEIAEFLYQDAIKKIKLL